MTSVPGPHSLVAGHSFGAGQAGFDLAVLRYGGNAGGRGNTVIPVQHDTPLASSSTWNVNGATHTVTSGAYRITRTPDGRGITVTRVADGQWFEVRGSVIRSTAGHRSFERPVTFELDGTRITVTPAGPAGPLSARWIESVTITSGNHGATMTGFVRPGTAGARPATRETAAADLASIQPGTVWRPHNGRIDRLQLPSGAELFYDARPNAPRPTRSRQAYHGQGHGAARLRPRQPADFFRTIVGGLLNAFTALLGEPGGHGARNRHVYRRR
jgi:hypothetical protein